MAGFIGRRNSIEWSVRESEEKIYRLILLELFLAKDQKDLSMEEEEEVDERLSRLFWMKECLTDQHEFRAEMKVERESREGGALPE